MNRAQRRAMESRSRADLRQSNKELIAFKRAASAKTGIPVAHMVIVARGDELMVFDKRQPWDKLDAALEAAGYQARPDIIVIDDAPDEGWKPAEPETPDAIWIGTEEEREAFFNHPELQAAYAKWKGGAA